MVNIIIKNPKTGRKQTAGGKDTFSKPSKLVKKQKFGFIGSKKPGKKKLGKDKIVTVKEPKLKSTKTPITQKKPPVSSETKKVETPSQQTPSAKQEALKQQAIERVSEPRVTSRVFDPKTGLTETTIERSFSQTIRAAKLKALPASAFQRPEPTAKENLGLVDQAREELTQERITREKAQRLGLTTKEVKIPVPPSLSKAVERIGETLKPGTQPLFNVGEKFPKTTAALRLGALTAGVVLITKQLPQSVTTGTLFRTGERALTTAFMGSKVIEFQTTPSKKAFAISTGVELAAMGGGGLIASKGPQLFKAVKKGAGVKLEQFQINLALQAEGGKIVTKDFFSRADIGKATIEGEALVSARGVGKVLETPFGKLESRVFTPKLEKVKVTFDPRKPPLPDDFLFKGTVTRKATIKPVAGSKPGVSTPQAVLEKTIPVSGFGFPKSLDIATTPLKSMRISKGRGLPIVSAKSSEFNIEFVGTKLARGQSVAVKTPGGFARKPTGPKKKATRLERQLAGELGVSSFAEGTEGTLLFTKRGRLFAPKGVAVKESPGKVGGFFNIQKATSKQILQRFPVVAKRVKLEVAKPKKPKVSKTGVEVEVPVRTATGQVLIQKLILEPPKLKETQQQKQKVKAKQKTKQRQKLSQVLGVKQKAKAKTKQTQKVGLLLKQKVTQKQAFKVGTKQRLSFAAAVAQSQKVDQAIAQAQKPKLAQAPKIKEGLRIAQKPALDVKLKITPALKIKPLLKTELIPILKTPGPKLTPPKRPRIPKIPRTPKIPTLKFPKLKKGKKKGKNKLDRTLEYKPSLVAGVHKIRGSRSKILSGLEIRPL